MRPVSGEDLVTAALQSSLARAQKNYTFSTPREKLASALANRPVKQVNGGGRGQTAGKRPTELLLQSEFDLWIEHASELTYIPEGYTNGAVVPPEIECLNSSAAQREQKDRKKLGQKPVFKPVLLRKSESATTKATEVVSSENSFDIFKQLKENRKEKKKLIKLKKQLMKLGHSQEDVEKLICKEKSGGVGSIGAIQKLRAVLASAELRGLATARSLLPNSSKKSLKMKDCVENGESSSSSPSVSSARVPESSGGHSSSTTVPNNSTAMNGGGGGSCGGGSNSSSGNHSHLPQPKLVLYPREKIIPGYQEKMPIGAGFYNMGNSCYLNASLQAVFHVPAFTNWLRQDAEHRKHCLDNVNCIVCAMKKTLDSAMSRQNPPPNAIRPVEIINRLRSICRHFSHGRQEDAHEFLRYLFESMERSYLAAINCLRLDNRSKETNPLGQIFGGYIRTEVTCLKCHYVSTTFQPTAELQLDIRHHTTLDDALQNHFKKERLDNNDYKCEKCRTISQATKQFSLEIPPIVLCLQLKRFTLYGTKIAKRIHCNRYLNLSKYMHKSKQTNGCSDLRYRLVALVTHLGSSPNCGHYTAIAEAQNGNFYQFDDSYVHQVTLANALNNDAYVIIFEIDKRTHKSPESGTSSSGYTTNATNVSYAPSTVTSTAGGGSSSIIGSNFPKKLPSSYSNNSPLSKVPAFTSSKLVKPSENDCKPAGSLVNGNLVLSPSSESVNGMNGNENSNRGLGMNRKLVSFGIRSPSAQGTFESRKISVLKSGATLTNSSKLGIGNKNGVVGSSVSSGGSSSKENKSELFRQLVPYKEDENEESDKEEARVSSNNGNRLKSPEKQSELPGSSTPKSPKSTAVDQGEPTDSSKSSSTPVKEDSNECQSPRLELQKEVAKRKASEDESTPRKSRLNHKRRSSSASSSSSESSDDSRRNNQGKRKREEGSRSSERKSLPSSLFHSPESRRDRDSYSQERDRERRRDRNPSRSRSPVSGTDNHNNSRRSDSGGSTNGFDPSRLKNDNSTLTWDGHRSMFSRSMEEDRKRLNDKNAEDEYDEEFDEGRTKKARRSLSLPRESESSTIVGNRFQNVEDRKRQVDAWKNIADTNAASGSFRRCGSNDSKSWSNGDDSSRHRRSFPPRPNSSGGNSGPRPRHSSSHSNSNYPRSHVRGPYRHGNGGGGGNHYRNQGHSFHHGGGNNKFWNGGSERNRH